MPRPTPYLPPVRRIAASRPLAWLALGWRDLRRVGMLSLAHGAALALFGLLIAAVARERFWLLVGALSGFLVVAPVLATSFYVLSRALERGEPANLQAVLRTCLFWQRGRQDHADGQDYWCLVKFGLLLALAGTGWVLTSAALITLLAPQPVRAPADFVQHVVLARDSGLFALWLALGSLLAAPIFASSVVAIPLLLDRRATLRQAVLASWQAVLANPLPLALWAALLLALTLLGLAPWMLGLVLVMPVLGHASWHAYRELLDADALAPREPAAGDPAGLSSTTVSNGMAT
ncbi:Uncharacterized membrane protein [Oryzisolibacter propanilivorax]|uniref:Uncharacterized membrane protein n=1 Tax=Oryzisolibacter propanilivorax TaxID=1527607 RepID=A0A1G9TKN2_9BURK|nr:DUF2189 domain-containing protein [Oryzisolibacter propanilivorax]SDM47984.1 Uncharacterized membrane protein [Oryzisolibacter propanilivorax]